MVFCGVRYIKDLTDGPLGKLFGGISMKDLKKLIASLLMFSIVAFPGCRIVTEPEVTTESSVVTATERSEEFTTTTTAETTTEATTTETTAEATTTTEETTESSAKDTATGFEPLVSKNLPSDGIPDRTDLKDNDVYYAFMTKIDEIERDYPGTTYGFVQEYVKEIDGLCWALVTSNAEYGKGCYCADGSTTMDFKSRTIVPEKMLDYETVRSLPLILEITEGDFKIESNVPDGYYFGDDIAYTKDGKYLLFRYGKACYIKKEDAEKLKAGDRVAFEGSGETFMVDEGTSGVDATFDEDSYWLDEIYLPDDMKGSYYMLSSASDNPVYGNIKIALLPIPEDVKMSDTFKFLYGDSIEEYSKTYKKSGNTFLDSDYYISNTFCSEFATETNGYVSGQAFLYPIVIKDGKISEINFEWR